MKIFRLLSFFYLLALLGCDNDLNLITDYEDIPVVYGLLSVDDPVHYVRVERAYLDPETSALDLALIPDSIYYSEDVTVRLQKVSTGELFEMDRVNGEDIGLPRDPGIFASSPNILYALDAEDIELEGGDQVKLIIDRPGLAEASAQTTMVRPFAKGVNSPPSTTSGSQGLFIFPDETSTWSFQVNQTARVYDVSLLITVETSRNGTVTSVDEVEWVIENSYRPDDSDQTVALITVENNGFYNALAAALDAENGVSRRVTGLEYVVTGAGTALNSFLNITAANTGITSAQERPRFTNVEGGEGVFSSIYRFELSNNLFLSSGTVNALGENELTGPLGF